MTHVIRVAEKHVSRRIAAIALIFPYKQRDRVTRLLMVNVSLDLCTGIPVVTLALPVEQLRTDCIIIVHRGWREFFLRLIQVNEKNIRRLLRKILHALPELRRLCLIEEIKRSHNLRRVVLTVQLQRTCERILILPCHEADMIALIVEDFQRLIPDRARLKDAGDSVVNVAKPHFRRMLIEKRVVKHVTHEPLFLCARLQPILDIPDPVIQKLRRIDVKQSRHGTKGPLLGFRHLRIRGFDKTRLPLQHVQRPSPVIAVKLIQR